MTRDAVITYDEVQSDLFRESGVNASTDPIKITVYAAAMRRYGGWGRFPPIHGTLHHVDAEDVADYHHAEEQGYEYELAWSRPVGESDIGTVYVGIDDGHNRAWAAREAEVPIRVRRWERANMPRRNFGTLDPAKYGLDRLTPPDGPLYHVTLAALLPRIAADGLWRRGSDGTDRGIFLTELAGVLSWYDFVRSDRCRQSRWPAEEGAVPVALRVYPHEQLQLDVRGTLDGTAWAREELARYCGATAPKHVAAWLSPRVPPDRIEVWDGSEWCPVHEWQRVNVALGIGRDGRVAHGRGSRLLPPEACRRPGWAVEDRR